ncbi:MAG: PTS system mannose/fructose/sorbose family transporter subunit IID [Yersiniaceae bacterium]|nr:PTS system mannose/fructose/sorbose family transporter subunit IID [Yersiniaceae bacterium]
METTPVTLTKQDLRRCWRAWMMYNLSSMSFERLQAYGFCLGMLPALRKLYPDAAQRTEAIRRHASFYNTEPQIGAIVNGMVIGLEEKRANGEPVDGETINTLKVGLMGSLAGIGDSMLPGMLIPIMLSIGMALAAGGSILGPLFYIIAYAGIVIPASWWLFNKGYRLGSGSVEMLVNSRSVRLREALSLLGVFVMGGVAASYVKLTTGLTLSTKEGVKIQLQQMLDGIFPQLLPLLVLLATWYLMSKRGLSPVKAMLGLLALAAVGVVTGLFS